MLLPHRTAWTTPKEFQSVYSDLFESDANQSRQSIALSRIAVWQTRNQCPSAVETTANFIRLILLDQSTHSVHSVHELRLSYSMTIIRFVNSLVDPLQTAYFARSISSLANQLGLPLWFVELRHQATHEELPGLPILREGARQALDWLYTNYWVPAINNSSSSLPSTSSSSSSTLPPLPIEPFLRSLNTYKSLSKSLQKDASQSGRIKNELGRVWRELERWGVENGLIQNLGRRKEVNPNGLGKKTAREARERAMERVAGLLIDEPGWLVPLAKKKRPSTRSPNLSHSLLELYTPLLDFLDETLFASSPTTPTPSSSSSDLPDPDSDESDSFLDVLTSRMVDILCLPSNYSEEDDEIISSMQQEQDSSLDPTIHSTLQAWVLHLLPIPIPIPIPSMTDDAGVQDLGETVETIEGIVKTCLIAQTPSSISLVEAILERSKESLPRLGEKVRPLLEMLRNNRDTGFAQSVAEEEVKGVVEEMVRIEKEIERRMAARENTIESSSQPLSSNPTTASISTSTASTTTKGWKLVENFRPSPIGSLPPSGFEGLDLVRMGMEVEMRA